MTLIERVARALHDEWFGVGKWSSMGDAERRRWAFMARAAIEAMRDPTNQMVDVGTEARWRLAVRDANSVREIWANMIDAALAESKEG